MNSVFDNGIGRIGEAFGATPHADANRYGDATDHVSFVGPLAKGDFSIFLDQAPSLAKGTSRVLLLARHARLTVLSGIAAPSSD